MIPLALLLSALAASPDVAEGDVDRARAAVERSLPFLEKEGVAWIEKRGCNSCHVVTFMLWSHEEARAKGIPVDLQKLAGWRDWSVKDSTAARSLRWLTAPILRWNVSGMARQFIAGRNPEDVMKTLRKRRAQKIGFTVDLLGEAVVSEQESRS